MLNEEKIVSSINSAWKSGYPHAKNAIGPLSYNTQNINWKWIKSLNLRFETVKFLQENMSIKCLNIGFGNILDMTPKAQSAKAKINN